MPFRGEPNASTSDPTRLALGYLNFYGDVVLRKLQGLTDDVLRQPVVPSGWSLLGLVKHLAATERFWVQYVFAGSDVDFRWPGSPELEWKVQPDESAAMITAFFSTQRSRTEVAVQGHKFEELAARELEFGRPTLGWVLFHLLQETARHAGHLDIGRELTDGEVEHESG
jgi:uncharacterized damage-inducible protein DinB